ncbi:MAG: hypothetical protein FJ271_09945 [Planctomycetes bacterium]|nr:hypothetical protein [Planctomycetota bacterium]
MRRTLMAACVLGVALPVVAQQTQSQSQDGGRVSELIKQLGSSKFAERERAAKELEAIGEPALPALRAIARSAEAGQGLDLEVIRRAAEIQRRLEEKIATAQILAPRRVRLKLKDVSVLDAIKELENQSKYPIMVQGDAKKLAAQKITIDTGDTTFWEAFDQLCQKAGLVDGNPYLPAMVPPPMPPIRIRPPNRKPRPLPVLPVIPPKAAPKGPVLIEARAAAAAALEIKPPAPVVQAQPVQAPPPAVQIQLQPARNPGYYLQEPRPSNYLQVRSGKPVVVPTSYSGAVRIRAHAKKEPARKDEVVVLLDVWAEPRLQNFALTSSPRVDKASDDQGQALSLNIDRTVDATHVIHAQGNRQAVRRFKLGEKKAKLFKELTGSLTAQALMPTETLVSVPDVLKGGGKTVKGKGGATMQVVSAAKQKDGTFSIQVRMGNLPGQNVFGGVNGVVIQQIQIQGGGNIIIGGMPQQQNVPTLVDKDGKNFQLVNIPSRRMQITNGVMSQELTMVFRANAGQNDPDRLLFTGQRTVTFQVPFAFRNIDIGQAEVGQPMP